MVASTKIKLDPLAVKKANEALWKSHPELKGRQLTMNKDDYTYRVKWMAIYRKEAKNREIIKQKIKEAGLKTNKTTTQPCPRKAGNLPEQAVKKDESVSKEKCGFESISIVENGRDYTRFLQTNGQEKMETIFSIVAGHKNKPADMSITANGLLGPCKSLNHKENWINANISLSEVVQNKPGSLKFKAYSFNQNWLPSKMNPRVLRGIVATCDQSTSFLINVYPDNEFEISIEFPMTTKKDEKAFSLKNLNELYFVEIEREKSLTEAVKISGQYKKDGLEHSVELEFERIIQTVRTISNITQCLQKTLSIVKNQGLSEPISFEIYKPSIKISWAEKWEEDQAGSDVNLKKEISIGLDPLLGAKASIDLIFVSGVVLGGPMAKVLNYVRKKAKKNFELKFDLSILGSISGSLIHFWDPKEKKLEIQNGKIEGKIGVELELSISGKFNVFFLKAGGEASGIAEGSISLLAYLGEKELEIKYRQNGIKISFAAEFKVGCFQGEYEITPIILVEEDTFETELKKIPLN